MCDCEKAEGTFWYCVANQPTPKNYIIIFDCASRQTIGKNLPLTWIRADASGPKHDNQIRLKPFLLRLEPLAFSLSAQYEHPSCNSDSYII